MVKELKVKIKFKKNLKEDICLLGFDSFYIAKNAKPGQFLHIKIDDKLTILRRPFSIHKVFKNTIYILFRIRGRGTKILSELNKENILDIIGPLGNSFKYKNEIDSKVILIAGGMGVAPLLFLAEKIKKLNAKTNSLVLLGANSRKYILLKNEFEKLGYKTYIATEDGSLGFKGKVTDILKKILLNLKYKSLNIYACGPNGMFLEIFNIIKPYPNINCYISFEQFMGCGLGICYGCSIETKNGYKKICKDGPVFDLKELYA